MFFRKKGKDAAAVAAEIKSSLGDAKETVEGTAPELVEAEMSAAAEETVEAAVVEPATTTLAVADAEPGTDLAAPSDTIRLFPGFERDDFEVGFRADQSAPALVMRWKDGGEWFTMPGLFNRAVLAAMDERDSASDLNRLLRNYGYDVETN